MEGKFTDFSKDDRDYPDVKGTIQKVAFPKPQSTVASESMAKARKSKEEQVRRYYTSLLMGSMINDSL